MQTKFSFFLILFLLLVVSCAGEPQTIVETVVHETTVEVEVTRLVDQEVEITREIEVTREVEVTREIIQEVEVPVEVTRIVEVEMVVTATPEPTPEPTPKPATAAQPADTQPTAEPVQDIGTTLLAYMTTTRDYMHSFGGQIDAGLRGDPFNCFDSVYAYDAIVQAPTLDVSTAPPEVQTAYGHYRSSIDIFGSGAYDMAQNCRELVNGTKESAMIGYQQWSIARSQVNQAIDMITPGIQMLGGE
jgi:hypothetical protein